MILGIVGPFQIIIMMIIPGGIFLLGFLIGKKVGYTKRVKETESRNR